MRARKKSVEVEAHRWWKNGDHPCDRVGKEELDTVALYKQHPELFANGDEVGPVPDDAPTFIRQEGAVVRFFRHPEYPGTDLHDRCGFTWNAHGWIDTLEGGHTVCPGDYIITGVQGENYPIKSDIFDATYDVLEE